MRGGWRRRWLAGALSVVAALGIVPIGDSGAAAALPRNPRGVGLKCPDTGRTNLTRLPGRDGRTGLPQTNPPRSYEYAWPDANLANLPPPGSGLPGAPTLRELALIGTDPYDPSLDLDPFTGRPDPAGRARREVIARWNRAVAKRLADIAAGKTTSNGKPLKPYTLADWAGHVARITKAQRSLPMGDAYEDLVRRILGLNGSSGWICNESMRKKGGHPKRFYDAVNHSLRLIYEFKSECNYKKEQLDRDIAFMKHQETLPESERYTIVYIFGVERCNRGRRAMQAAGIQRYTIAADGKVKADTAAVASQAATQPATQNATQAAEQKAAQEAAQEAAQQAAQEAASAAAAAEEAAQSVLTVPGQAPAAGSLVRAVAATPATAEEAELAERALADAMTPADDPADWTADELGGVDFTTLELRYLADPAKGEAGLQYAFSVRPNADGSPSWGGLRALQESSDSFFVWLALDPSRLWVNLHPDEPRRIIDPELGRTDAGRVLLEADLQMKKTVGRIIHPDTRTGAAFWKKIRDGDSGTCLSFRQWIVPAPATVREDGGGLHIVDAPLAVKLATEHRAAEAGARDARCRADKAIDEHNENVFREIVLPRVEKAVNTAPEYAALRRVYLTRVAAEWYKQRSLTKATALQDVIGSGSTARWPARTPWKPRDVFDRFVKSYRDGEFTVKRSSRTHITTYVYGGVDFSASPRTDMGGDEFTARHADLPGTVSEARQGPVFGDEAVWLGGESADRASGPPGGGRNAAIRRIVIPLIAGVSGLIVIGVAIGVIVLVLGRRPRRRNP